MAAAVATETAEKASAARAVARVLVLRAAEAKEKEASAAELMAVKGEVVVTRVAVHAVVMVGAAVVRAVVGTEKAAKMEEVLGAWAVQGRALKSKRRLAARCRARRSSATAVRRSPRTGPSPTAGLAPSGCIRAAYHHQSMQSLQRPGAPAQSKSAGGHSWQRVSSAVLADRWRYARWPSACQGPRSAPLR